MIAKIYLRVIFSIIIHLLTTYAYADDGVKFSELRIFGAANTFTTEPTALNNLTAADNVQKLDSITGLGLEADAKYKSFKFGTRFKYVLMSKEPANAAVGGNSALTISQYSTGLLGRFPIIENSWAQFDAFIELGMANTTIDVKTSSSGKGTFKKDGSFYQRAGASIGAGGPAFKFYVEAGQEWNNMKDLTFSGTLSNNISAVDLSGPYFAVGIIISGLPSWIKPGGITVGK